MDNYISIPNVTLLVTLAATFAVLFTIVLKIFKGVAFFDGKTAVIMAVCVCIIGLSQFVVVSGGAHDVAEANKEMSVPASQLLLPYFALAVAVAVLLSHVLLLASRTPVDEQSEPFAKKFEQAVVEPKSPGRPKKKESEHPPVPQKFSRKGKSEVKASSPTEVAATT